MTARRGKRLSPITAFLAAASLLGAACAPLPAQAINVTDTIWVVAAIDGEAARPGVATVHFHDLDAATIETDCFLVETGLAVDTDGYAFSFAEPIERLPKDCEAEEMALAERRLDALFGTDVWSVIDQGTIELTGEHRLRLERVM